MLSKDYSIHDQKNIGSFFDMLKGVFSNSGSQNNVVNASVENTSAVVPIQKFDIKQLPEALMAFTGRHRKTFAIFAVLLSIWVCYVLVLDPFGQREQDHIEMRPAQWSQLQSLIHPSKTSGSTAPSSGLGNSMPMLDDLGAEGIRAELTARGLKPGLLRLSADNPPRLEFQIGDAMFSVWLDVLEGLRITWRLYPDQLSVIAGSGVGMVNVSGVLKQYGRQELLVR